MQLWVIALKKSTDIKGPFKKEEQAPSFHEVPVPGMRANVKYHRDWVGLSLLLSFGFAKLSLRRGAIIKK
jgi:hypothetical protein